MPYRLKITDPPPITKRHSIFWKLISRIHRSLTCRRSCKEMIYIPLASLRCHQRVYRHSDSLSLRDPAKIQAWPLLNDDVYPTRFQILDYTPRFGLIQPKMMWTKVRYWSVWRRKMQSYHLKYDCVPCLEPDIPLPFMVSLCWFYFMYCTGIHRVYLGTDRTSERLVGWRS
jgi:hypothetical protein